MLCDISASYASPVLQTARRLWTWPAQQAAAVQGKHCTALQALHERESAPLPQEAGQAAEEAESRMESQAIKQWTSFMRNSRSMQVSSAAEHR